MQPEENEPKKKTSSPAPRHPLAGDDPTLRAQVLDDFLSLNPDGSLTELVLGETEAARRAWAAYTSRQKKSLARANLMLVQSILATVDLHRRGVTAPDRKRELTDLEYALVAVATAPYGEEAKEFLIKSYRLDSFEALAIEGYTNANKAERWINGKPNPHYMGENGAWGKYRSGWVALGSALQKLPSVGELGVVVTTYRASRETSSGNEVQKIAKLEVETVVWLGMKTMDMGQRHFLSTALTYNGHWGRARDVGGMIGVTGTSGRYINPLGVMGWVDGAEILYPPGVVTVFEGVRPDGYQDRGGYPVVHLREVTSPESYQAVSDDSEYALSKTRHKRLDSEKLRLIGILEQNDPDRVRGVMEKLGLGDRDVMYLTYDELQAIVKRVG
jgi:hypothetical protein